MLLILRSELNGAYGHTKLANVLFTKEISKRLASESILAFTLHPGGEIFTQRLISVNSRKSDLSRCSHLHKWCTRGTERNLDQMGWIEITLVVIFQDSHFSLYRYDA